MANIKDTLTPEVSAPQISRREFAQRLFRTVRDTMLGASLAASAASTLGEKIVEKTFNVAYTSEGSKELAKTAGLEVLPPILLNGQTIVLAGVEHIPETMQKNEAAIRKLIQDSNVIILENANADFFNQIPLAKNTADLAQKLEQHSDNLGMIFMSQLAKICAEEGKSVIVFNPAALSPNSTTTLDDFEAGAIAGPPAYIIAKKLLALEEKKPRALISRREALGLSGGIVLSLWHAYSQMGLTVNLRQIFEGKKIESADVRYFHGEANVLGHEILDFRNIYLAECLDQLTRLLSQSTSRSFHITVFEGMFHNATAEYLKNPELLRNKALTYPDYTIAARDFSPQLLTFNQQSQRWEQQK